LRRIARSIHFRINAFDRLEGKEGVFQQLVEAIGARRVVRMVYDSLTEWEVIRTKIRPYQLLFNRHSWYVIGRSSRHAEPRTFNLARIHSLELTNEKYVMPRGFSVDRYLGNAWNLMSQVGGDTHVVVRFSQMMAKNVAEVTWHKTQRCEPRPDGTLDFHVDVSGLSEIVWWILGYGEHARVLKPVRLQRLVAQRARKMHELYAP
jgi:proteasome accessory factor B